MNGMDEVTNRKSIPVSFYWNKNNHDRAAIVNYSYENSSSAVCMLYVPSILYLELHGLHG